jgi:D-serine deaminase-like pyridoxal phosphate-dependent protein
MTRPIPEPPPVMTTVRSVNRTGQSYDRPVDADALTRLRDDPVDWRYKGFPAAAEATTVATVRDRAWNLLAGDLPTPLLVLRESALAHNLDLMARWCAAHGASLAPHGKTTMSPELWHRQLEAGAWGITAANVAQVRVMRAFGVERVVLANELVEPVSLRWVADQLARDPAFDFYCLVDSVAGVDRMSQALGRPSRAVPVLVELGFQGGRTGARTEQEALAVARAAEASDALELAGVEAYEGILHGDDEKAVLHEVDAFLDRVQRLVEAVALARDEVVVTAGGSAYFDRVAERLRSAPGTRLVLRSGCYVTHDSGFYEHLSPLGARSDGTERLRAAFEAWGAVVSRPEPGLALLLLGKRDVAHDIDLPMPFAVAHDGVMRSAGAMTVTDLNDQHAYLRLPPDDPLAVGDLVGCGISHPCTAFDKWRLIPVVDDDHTVVDAVHTFF